MASETEQVFYKLSEISILLGVGTSVLRFWEKEFGEALKPLQVGPRKRLYRPRDLEIFREIKRLLQEERYTIAGARRRLSMVEAPAGPGGAEAELTALRSVLTATRRELKDLRRLLAPEAKDQAGENPDQAGEPREKT
jgi:DNA-binding transcriptional MerR regulator